MHLNILKGEIRAQGKSQKDIADAMGISLSAFNAKLNEKNGAEFSLGEIKSISVILGLDINQVVDIFLT